MKYLSIIILITLLILLQSCGSSKSSAGNNEAGIQQVETNGNNTSSYQNLADYLRRLPSVRVTGSGDNINVNIRGSSSFTSDTRPLYVVDGQPRGTSYAEVNRSIDISEIASVRVLTDSDAAAYGVRGANGVIEITLKR